MKRIVAVEVSKDEERQFIDDMNDLKSSLENAEFVGNNILNLLSDIGSSGEAQHRCDQIVLKIRAALRDLNTLDGLVAQENWRVEEL